MRKNDSLKEGRLVSRGAGAVGAERSKQSRRGGSVKWRAFMVHLTHYAPGWLHRKKHEKRFDRKLAEKLIREASAAGFNMLIIDIKDAVVYRGLPDIRRQYSVPMRELVELAGLARSLGLEVVPKLNFSKSNEHRHSQWLWKEQRPPDSKALWSRAITAIEEVVAAVEPRIVHVGMDEDDTRSPEEYRDALQFLYRQLRKRKLRMMMWADCGHQWRAAERWKVLPAIMSLPRDVILLPWKYERPLPPETEQLIRAGFDVIGTCMCPPPGKSERSRDFDHNAKDWFALMKKAGGSGFLLSQWSPCRPCVATKLLGGIRACGRMFALEQDKN